MGALHLIVQRLGGLSRSCSGRPQAGLRAMAAHALRMATAVAQELPPLWAGAPTLCVLGREHLSSRAPAARTPDWSAWGPAAACLGRRSALCASPAPSERQLQLYGADVICVQGLQSIGFSERCSETQVAWFSCEDEPTSNHLVHLYRELAKAGTARLERKEIGLYGGRVTAASRSSLTRRRGGVAQLRPLASRLSATLLHPELLCPRTRFERVATRGPHG